ncbi:hypothetical protein [Bacillus sp. 7894-2]|uniref:hypothetical protein n=1 Tax=Bacillus sp. 7894-2 TaxID=2021695 RepID=UPI000BA7DA08|nr:hypothetical protein [Bacillus sp. 7894-2]PAE23914.1 hypothetical protein CHI10_15860 [Bacillus sp. 7894-2]
MAKGKLKNTVLIGDVFAVSLPDGRYGAIRVADQIDKSYLIITTPYIGTEIPPIENEFLGDILIQNRFFSKIAVHCFGLKGRYLKRLLTSGIFLFPIIKEKYFATHLAGNGTILLEWKFL